MKALFNFFILVLVSTLLTGCGFLEAVGDEIRDDVYNCIVVSNDTAPQFFLESYTGLDREKKASAFGSEHEHKFLANQGYGYTRVEIRVTLYTLEKGVRTNVVNDVFRESFSFNEKGCELVSLSLEERVSWNGQNTTTRIVIDRGGW